MSERLSGGSQFSHDTERQLIVPTRLVGEPVTAALQSDLWVRESAEFLLSREAETFPFNTVRLATNRSPLKTVTHPDGRVSREKTIGGLAASMLQWGLQTDSQVVWYAWNGERNGKEIEQGGLEVAYSAPVQGNGVEMVEFKLSPREAREYYGVMSNERFWYLFHELDKEYTEAVGTDFDYDAWQTYKRVNKKFAETMWNESQGKKEDFIWIHDYHLMTAASELRKKGSDQTIGFFLHIPFPPADSIHKLPHYVRRDILEGLLANDVIGFQTEVDRNNFLRTVQMFHPRKEEIQIEDTELGAMITIDGRKVVAQAFPISIDAEGLEKEAAADEVQQHAATMKQAWGEEKQTILHLSRLDPSKGIVETLQAYENALKYYEDLRGYLHLALAVDPGSRLNLEAYHNLDRAQRELVAKINAEYPGAVTHYDGLERPYALAALQILDIMAAKSGKDGMNLAVKETAVLGPEHAGIIMGEGVGAVHELGESSFVVDPKDTEGNAHVIYQAVMLPHGEKLRRKAEMKKQVHEHDVRYWGNRFIHTAAAMARMKQAA